MPLSESDDACASGTWRNCHMRTAWAIAASALVLGTGAVVWIASVGCGGSKWPAHGDGGSPDAVGPVPDGAPLACHTPLPAEPASTPYVLRFDQLGYQRAGRLWAVVLGAGQAAPHFRLYALASACFVGEGTAGPRVLDVQSRAGTPLTGDRVDLAAAAGASGDYLVVLDDGARFGPIHVVDRPYALALAKTVRFLRAQRCGATTMALSLHAACHLHASVTDGNAATRSGDGVAVDDGYSGIVNDTTGPAVDSEGGWHDAGDYIKFTGTTAFMLATDLIAMRDHRDALVALLGAAGYDDLRAEMRWGLDWMIKMLGGPTMYHQVSGERDHDGAFRLPEGDTASPVPMYTQRPVFRFADGKGGNIMGRAAAAFAAAAQVYADDPAYAATLLATARKVYAQGKLRPGAQSPDPPNFYGEDSVRDDLALGAAALARATGESGFRDEALGFARAMDAWPGSTLYWGGMEGLALLETGLAFPAGSPERAEMADKLTALAAPILASITTPRGPGAAFEYALDSFGNGTIEQSLGAAAVCLAARRLAGPANAGCLEVGRNQLHWLYGLNPFGVSYQLGVGTSYPQHPHHGLASTAHVLLDGAVVGGPTGADVIRGALPVPGASDPFAKWSTDALLYEDKESDWIVNEPAIDFSGPLVFVVAELAEP